MKRTTLVILAFATLLPGWASSQEKVRMDYFGDAYQLVYFGVLEGLFRDGVKTKEVDLILSRKDEGAHYDHFIYACPICMAVIHALEFYRDRPRFYGIKDFAPPAQFKTFGPGLAEEVVANLGDDDAGVRLRAIHQLVSGWVNTRLKSLDLSDDQREKLQVELKAGRDRGMEMLRGFQKDPNDMAFYAPAYANLKDTECAICNAALQMDFKPE